MNIFIAYESIYVKIKIDLCGIVFWLIILKNKFLLVYYIEFRG